MTTKQKRPPRASKRVTKHQLNVRLCATEETLREVTNARHEIVKRFEREAQEHQQTRSELNNKTREAMRMRQELDWIATHAIARVIGAARTFQGHAIEAHDGPSIGSGLNTQRASS